MRAYEALKEEGIPIRAIDLYSVKPRDEKTLQEAAGNTRFIVTAEDHYPAGGLGEAFKGVPSGSSTPVYSLSVGKKPKSGKPDELLDYEEISWTSIVETIKQKLAVKKLNQAVGAVL